MQSRVYKTAKWDHLHIFNHIRNILPEFTNDKRLSYYVIFDTLEPPAFDPSKSPVEKNSEEIRIAQFAILAFSGEF